DCIMKRLLPVIVILLVGMLLAFCCKSRDDGKKKPGEKPSYTLYHTKSEDHHLRLDIDKSAKEIKATVYDGDNAKVKPIDAVELLMILPKEKNPITFKADRAKSD